MALDKGNTDFIVDMTVISEGVGAYMDITKDAELIILDFEKACKDFPLSSWSGDGRDQFVIEAMCRTNEFMKLLCQMDETQSSLTSLLEGANYCRKEGQGLKQAFT